MENTTNLKMPLLIPNQSQKEITHNEALVIIDNILQNGVIDKDLTTPPSNPNTNDIYIVGASATCAWSGKDNQLAFYDNGWRFIEAREGFTFWVNDENKLYSFDGSNWIETLSTLIPTQNLNGLSDVAISSASQYDILQHNGTNFVNTKEVQNLSLVGVNTTANSTNKLSVKSDSVLFDNTTDDSRVKVNKATSTDTASHLFQSNYSGRAEFGLIGNDDFTLKVSSDGTNWNNSFVVNKTTGNIDFKANITQNGENIDVFKKVQTITLNGENEIEFTGLNDGYQHSFEFIDFSPSVASYLMCLIGKENSYFNGSYSSSLFAQDSNTTSQWINSSRYIYDGTYFKISFDHLTAWLLQPNKNSYCNFSILSDFTKSGIKLFEGETIYPDSTTIPYMLASRFKGLLNINDTADRIKFYLSSGNFASGIIKHYILK